ncbi:MAG: GTPase, partial [bacterium]|nr:GTPase [bacterium]
MALQIGIVGLPNVGKSTLFRALTKKQVPAENYPFTTIDPNVGVVEVPDDRLPQLAKVSSSEKIVPAICEFVDIAGLVRDAHKGEGLGNKFLANIREVTAIAHVVRVFTDPDVIHVDNRVDPTSDVETIETELALADLDIVKKRI